MKPNRDASLSPASASLMAGLRQVPVAAVIAVALLLQSCATRDEMSTSAIPDDYRTRHPIRLAEAEHTLDIPVAAADYRLSMGTKDVIRGFASNYSASSAGIVQIQLPQGSRNAAAAAALRGEIRHVLTQAGISPKRIMETRYAAAPQGDAAPVRLSYVAITAMTNPCGNWPEDLSNNTFGNRNWQNFGCASQNNLAAQIANPTDLISPRGMSPIDASRRGVVIQGYRSGIDTTTK